MFGGGQPVLLGGGKAPHAPLSLPLDYYYRRVNTKTTMLISKEVQSETKKG